MIKSLRRMMNQNDILIFLKQLLTEKLSGTTCISITEAEKVLMSILYVLNYAKEYEASDTQLSVEDRFLLGKKRINKKLEKTQLLYMRLVESKLDLVVESYQQTIKEFEKFFKDYDIQYNAHEVASVWIDYLLALPVDDQKNRGIDFVYAYLESLYFETNFCQLFSSVQLVELFEVYQEQLKMDYRKDINNIYERVFFQVIAKLLVSSRRIESLVLSNEELEKVLNRLEKIKKEELFSRMSAFLLDNDLTMNEYYRKTIQLFMTRIFQDDSKEYRKNLFISYYPEKTVFIPTEGMTISQFQMVLSASARMGGEEKAIFLKQNFQSIYDYFDLFELDELSSEELVAIYTLMGIEELSLLIKLLNSGGRESGRGIFEIELDDEKLWQRQLLGHLKTRTLFQQKQIEEYLESIELPFLDFD